MQSVLYAEDEPVKIVRNAPMKAKDARPKVRRNQPAVTVKRKTKVEPHHQGVVEVQGSYAASVRALVGFWDEQFIKATGLDDRSLSQDGKCEAMGEILDDLRDEVKIQRLIVALLTDKRAEWVSHKTLTWLSSARNRTFLAPMLIKTKPQAAEFRGRRAKELKFTFRK